MSKEKTLTFSFLQIHVLFHLMGSSHICHQICTQLNGFETNYACVSMMQFQNGVEHL